MGTNGQKPAITPKTRIGELLEAYPELEEVLLSLSPAFAKLKNPVLRKTVARVATLQQAAAIGGLKADYLVNRLRESAGISGWLESDDQVTFLSDKLPDWFAPEKLVTCFDATVMINAGESPMQEILLQARKLNPGEIFGFQTPFVPAPVVDMLKQKSFMVSTVSRGKAFITYVTPGHIQ